MSFYFKRSSFANQKSLVAFNGNRISTWHAPPSGRSVYEVQIFPNPSAMRHIPDDENPLVPPLHWHWYQEEIFTVTKGRFVVTVENKQFTVSAEDAQPVSIPARRKHTFKVDTTCEEPCEISIATVVSPLASDAAAALEVGMSERFFRNFYGYLEDCGAQKISPRLPQLLLFLHSAEVSLALPGPGWLARPLSYVFGLVVGKVIGGYVLGYKESYPEYYDPSKIGRD